MANSNYAWTDNPTVSGVSQCDTDVLNDCLMHLKYNHRTSGGGFSLFDTKITDHVLSGDEALGWVIQGGVVTMTYPDAVNVIKEEYSNGVEYTEGEITYRLSPSGRRITDISQYTNVDKLFETKGYAPYYVYDEVNQQFYLPKNKMFTQLTADTTKVNSTVEAGLPNITGRFDRSNRNGYGPAEGAFFHGDSVGGFCRDGSRDSSYVEFDASRSSSIYGNSDTVQPAAVLQLLYYKVGEVVINSDLALIDAQEMIEDAFQEVDTKINDGLNSLANASDALRQTQVTNCILEAPNNIKIDINENGYLVLKSGSTLIIPAGLDDEGNKKFEHKTLESDVVFTNTDAITGNLKDFMPIVWYSNDASTAHSIGGVCVSQMFAGETAPTNAQDMYWYDTANNLIKFSNDTGASWEFAMASFPICQVDVIFESASVKYFNYPKAIFSHCGFIGSAYWLDKEVKYLAPNGKSETGTLNNIEGITQDVQIHIITDEESNNTASKCMAWVSSNSISWWGNASIKTSYTKPSVTGYTRYFDDNENYWKKADLSTTFTNTNLCPFATFDINTQNQILSMQPYEILKVATGNNSAFLPDYTAGVTRNSGIEYFAEYDSYLYGSGTSASGSVPTISVSYDKVNWITLSHGSGTANISGSLYAWIPKGTYFRGTHGYSWSYQQFPLKGASNA